MESLRPIWYTYYTTNNKTNTTAMSGKTVVDFSVGYTAALALTNDGMVYSMDPSNNYGQSGDGLYTSHNLFTPSVKFNNAMLCGETIVNVYGGGLNSMVTPSYGRLLIVGSNVVRIEFVYLMVVVW